MILVYKEQNIAKLIKEVENKGIYKQNKNSQEKTFNHYLRFYLVSY